MVNRAIGAPTRACTPRPAVDLLAGDDGLDDLGGGGRASRTDGFGTAAAADDPALALLAELDEPMPARSAPPSLASVGVTSERSTAVAADPSLVAGGASGASAARDGYAGRPMAAAPTPGAPPPEVARDDSWLDALTNQVATLVGSPSTTSAAPRPAHGRRHPRRGRAEGRPARRRRRPRRRLRRPGRRPRQRPHRRLAPGRRPRRRRAGTAGRARRADAAAPAVAVVRDVHVDVHVAVGRRQPCPPRCRRCRRRGRPSPRPPRTPAGSTPSSPSAAPSSPT
ncbi:MAG: hypothetical protein R3F59_32495 [Myxococcota bacterium]